MEDNAELTCTGENMYCDVTELNCCKYYGGGGICKYASEDTSHCEHAYKQPRECDQVECVVKWQGVNMQDMKPVFGCIIAGINIACEEMNETPEMILELIKSHYGLGSI